MTWTIARKEIAELWRDGRFRWAAALVLVLLCGAVATGAAHQVRVEADREEARQTVRQQWLDQGDKNPHSAAHFSIYAFASPPPTALLDPGVAPYTGVGTWLEAHYQNEAVYHPARDATALSRFGPFTAAVVLQLLMPLLVVAFAFGAFAGERERGTLRLVASLGVSPRRLALGKALGVGATLAALIVPAALLGALALVLASSAGDSGAGLRLLGLGGAYTLYLATFVVLALAASAFGRTARAALGVLLVFWAFSGLLAPRVSSDLARAVVPTPSWHAFQAAVTEDIRGGVDGHDPTNEQTEALKEQLLAEHGVETVEELPMDFTGVAMQVGEDHSSAVYDQHYGALWARYDRQRRVRTLVGVLAPTLAIQDISMGIAGSDWAHHRHFAEAAERYRRDLVRTMNDETAYGGGGRAYEANLRGRDVWAQVPDFAYAPPSPAWAFRQQTGGLGILAAWLVVACVLLSVAARRYRLDR